MVLSSRVNIGSQKAVLQMLEKYLPWIGGVFAVIGLIIIICDIVSITKKRDKLKTNIAGVVILFVAVVGYIVTDFILVDSAWPKLASIIWIALFWVYVILEAIVIGRQIKQHRLEQEAAATQAQEEAEVSATETQVESTANGVKTSQKGNTKKSTQKQQRKVVIVKKKHNSDK